MPKLHLSSRVQALVLHDVALFVSAFLATDVLAADHLTVSVVVAAAVTALKVALRQLVPVPAAK